CKLMKFEWQDSFSIGVKQIDDQHKSLISLSNKFHNALLNGQGTDVIEDVLKFLSLYVKIHFKTEEIYMAEHNYPLIKDHKAEHLELIKFVDELKKSYVNNTLNHSDALKLNIKLYQWYLKHIAESDKKLGDYLQNKKLKLVEINEKDLRSIGE
ncbi:MAG: bacteriohemerythrin, partial [Deferribacterales bacterium]